MRIKIVIIAILFVGANLKVHAQQEIQYTQYMYNTVTINPAYAGSRGMLSFSTLYRNQWIGLDGAPTSFSFTGHTPLGIRGVGGGLSFVTDNIGPSNEIMGAADFSYTIYMSYRTKLSFGIKAGFRSLSIDSSKFNPDQQNDPSIYDQDNIISPLIGAGLYLHSDRWYVGLSAPGLLETDHYDDVAVSVATEKLHLYLIGGYVFDLDPTLKFKPAVLLKAVEGAPVALDLSANFQFNGKLILGAAYRLDAAVSALAGFQVSDRILVGYAYDHDTSKIGNYNNGSHEIFLRFELNNRSRGVVHPRFF